MTTFDGGNTMSSEILLGVVLAMLAAAVLLLVLLVVAWMLWSAGSGDAKISPAQTNAAAAAPPPSPPLAPLQPIDDAPFGIARRSTPEGADLDVVLPKQVGAFQRVNVREMDENWHYATYRSGGAEVFVELAISAGPEGAQQALGNARRETVAEFPDVPRQESIGTEPSYLATTTRLGAFIAWTRGPYYFSAHAKGGEGDIAAFQAAFPY
jgi:hypothetical protein